MTLRPTYPIETERLWLRPYRASDLEALHGIQSRADVARFLYNGPRSLAETQALLERRAAVTTIEAPGGPALTLAAIRRDDEALVGDVTLWWHSGEHQSGEIGFILHPDHQGRGLAREAAEVLLRLAFADLQLHRVMGRLDARNEASARLLARLGLRLEAHLRQNEFVKGEWTDELVYAILRDEWVARQRPSESGSRARSS